MNSSGGFFNKKIVKSACALFCAAGLLLSAAGCGVRSNVSVIKSDAPLKVTEATNSGESYRLIEDNANLKKVASSGLIELYFDSVTMAGVVRKLQRTSIGMPFPLPELELQMIAALFLQRFSPAEKSILLTLRITRWLLEL